MSTNNYGQKLLSVLFLVVFFTLILGLFRQILVYQRINRRLVDGQNELQALKNRNLDLKLKLEEIKNPNLTAEPASKSDERKPIEGNLLLNEREMPKYQKWWRLIFH